MEQYCCMLSNATIYWWTHSRNEKSRLKINRESRFGTFAKIVGTTQYSNGDAKESNERKDVRSKWTHHRITTSPIRTSKQTIFESTVNINHVLKFSHFFLISIKIILKKHKCRVFSRQRTKKTRNRFNVSNFTHRVSPIVTCLLFSLSRASFVFAIIVSKQKESSRDVWL